MRHLRPAVLIPFFVVMLLWAPAVAADEVVPLSGPWCGHAQAQTVRIGDPIGIFIFEYAPGLYAGFLDIPILAIWDQLVPVTVLGDMVIIGDPNVFALTGTRDGDVISGANFLPIPIPPYVDLVEWTLWKNQGQGAAPGTPPTQPCELPDLFVKGSATHSSELVPFEPVTGPGYVNNPANGETWDDQYRSYLRRDLRQLVQYATAKVECASAHWNSWPFAVLGMADMSEADGAIPGSSVGYPGHPPGTHEDGRDIDLAYYQMFAPDNLPRVIGYHHDANGIELYHLVEPPCAFDVWRTALLIAYLSEHPRLRVVGVDGQVGLLLESALDILVILGWLDADKREAIPLAYEVVDNGWGWFRFHHHHLHVSMRPLYDVLGSVEIKPETLNAKSKGKTVTAYIELHAGLDVTHVAADEVALVLDGHTLLYAKPGRARVGDHDKDGIPDLMVKFDRRTLQKYVGGGTVELTLTGRVGYFHFQGTDSIRVIHAK